MFIVWYERPALLKLGEHVSQNLRSSCSSHEMKLLLAHQPEFSGLSFTLTAEVEKKFQSADDVLVQIFDCTTLNILLYIF